MSKGFPEPTASGEALLTVITNLTASLDALILTEEAVGELLANTTTGIADACATEVAPLLESIEGSNA